MKLSQNPNTEKVWGLIQKLQQHYLQILEAPLQAKNLKFNKIDWLRDEGRHGGGWRLMAPECEIYNRATINISHVQYDDAVEKPLESATALSTIVHPHNPLAPSSHMHFSWTALKSGAHYWRLMADLNPAIIQSDDKKYFDDTIKNLAGEFTAHGMAQGEKYFMIPELQRTRGVSHFYLEQHNTGDFERDIEFTEYFAKGMMNAYGKILHLALESRNSFSEQDKKIQLDYHTLYLFQVLTLDRGTTSGILAHNQNDLGIMGSLPNFVDRSLLKSWINLVSNEKKELLQNIIDAIEVNGEIDDECKLRLVSGIRSFYKKYPASLQLQASGFVTPDSFLNHNKNSGI